MKALGQIGHRYAGTEGERAMVHAVKSRLPPESRARVEGFVAYTSPAFVTGLHAAVLLAAGVLGFVQPLAATLICAAVTAHLVSESTGGFSVIRRVLPKDPSYNLVQHLPAGDAHGTVVVTAGLDQPRWRPSTPWALRPLRAIIGAASIVTIILLGRSLAEPWGRPTQGMYIAALVVLAVSVGMAAFAHRRAGTREDASAPAALLEMLRRLRERPLPGLDVWVVFTGCSHAYQNGMGAFLAMRKGNLVDPLFVLALDRPGCADVGAVVAEGPVMPVQHRPTGPAMVERLRWAGLEIDTVDRPYVTDARAARLWGYRALALSGSDGPSDPAVAARTVDIAESIVRLYAEDVDRVHMVRAEAEAS